MWEYNYNYNDELYNYGVPGMKWGQRRAAKRAAKIDKRLSKLKGIEKDLKKKYDADNAKAREKYSGKKLKAVLAKNKTNYDLTVVNTREAIARYKAKKDPSYKNTPAYAKARKDFGKRWGQQVLLGERGQKKLHNLRNQGVSNKQAYGRVIGGIVASTVALSVLKGAASAVVKNKLG